ncbi:hypothetical protein JTB14_008084 [Gonioctena quinquepunctata]|nr:hypothetical protein JTB14_008084 [Gonioctena quinquepunctata]
MDLARHLSGDLTEEFGRDGGDISSLWSRARNATRRLDVPNTNSNFRPDIVVINENESKITIVDVSIPFENEPQALYRARQAKLEKYNGIAEELRAQGYETSVDAFIVGALGTWDPENEEVLKEVRGVPKATASFDLSRFQNMAVPEYAEKAALTDICS